MLTKRQLRFCDEYLIDLNASAAAARAGYAPAVSNREGSRLLSNADIQARIQKGIERRITATGLKAEAVVMELAKLAFFDPGDVFDFTGDSLRLRSLRDISPYARQAIQSLKVKRIPDANGTAEVLEVKFSDKRAALDLLGRHLGLFETKVRLSGSLDASEKPDSPFDYSKLTTEELETLEALMDKAAA